MFEIPLANSPLTCNGIQISKQEINILVFPKCCQTSVSLTISSYFAQIIMGQLSNQSLEIMEDEKHECQQIVEISAKTCVRKFRKQFIGPEKHDWKSKPCSMCWGECRIRTRICYEFWVRPGISLYLLTN